MKNSEANNEARLHLLIYVNEISIKSFISIDSIDFISNVLRTTKYLYIVCRRGYETCCNDEPRTAVNSCEDVFVPILSADRDYGITMQQEDRQLDTAQSEIKRLPAEVESLRQEQSLCHIYQKMIVWSLSTQDFIRK